MYTLKATPIYLPSFSQAYNSVKLHENIVCLSFVLGNGVQEAFQLLEKIALVTIIALLINNFGLCLDQFCKRYHSANMSKEGLTGSPFYRGVVLWNGLRIEHHKAENKKQNLMTNSGLDGS